MCRHLHTQVNSSGTIETCAECGQQVKFHPEPPIKLPYKHLTGEFRKFEVWTGPTCIRHPHTAGSVLSALRGCREED